MSDPLGTILNVILSVFMLPFFILKKRKIKRRIFE